MRTIWILLPAFNEQEPLPVLLPKIARTMADARLPWRLVVVDDGSSDGTPHLLEQFRASYPLDVVTHPLNRGLGETERDGFEYIAARAEPVDVLIRMDCDDTHEPRYMFDLLAKLDDGCDVVNTSRFRRGGDQKGVSTYRAIISYAANVFMRLVFAVPGTRDYSSGYRAYRCRVIQDAIRVYGDKFIQLRGLGFTSTLETIIKLHLLGCRFGEVPFVLRYDQKASASKMLTSLTTLGYLTMATLYHWPFGGWRRQYAGLRGSYRRDPEEAVQAFGRGRLPARTASRISL